jgi:hypothetical protein
VGPNNTASDAGTFNDPELVSTEIGCIGQRGIVVAPFGVLFQSPRGFFLLGQGLDLKYIGVQLEGLTGNQAVSDANPVNGAVFLPQEQQVRFTSSAVMWVFDYAHEIWTVYTSHGGVLGPSVQWNDAHVWASATILQESPDALFTTANMRVVLGWARLAPSTQEDMRVKSVRLTGKITGTSANLRVKLYKNFSASVVQTATQSAIPAGPLLWRHQNGAGARVASALKVEIDDNSTGADGTLSLTEIVLELAQRRRGASRRVG